MTEAGALSESETYGFPYSGSCACGNGQIGVSDMIANRHVTKIVAALMAAAVLFCLTAMAFSEQAVEVMGEGRVSMAYETGLFDRDRILSVEILMEEEDWEDMLEHALEESYHPCDVVINGERLYQVGIRTKGNTSLSSIAGDPENDRYSFKLEFDHYVEGQTCLGLDKLILNNNFADITNMKEAVAYDMYRFLGADASLYNYAEIFVNGSYWGVYLALEAVEESFLLRNYGVEDGKLYKPEGMDMGGPAEMPFGRGSAFENGLPDGNGWPDGNGGFPDGSGWPDENRSLPDGNGWPDENGSFPDGSDRLDEKGMLPENGKPYHTDFPKGEEGAAPDFPGRFSEGSGGADLNYVDEDPDNYSAIWEGSVGKSSEGDHARVVDALKRAGEGEETEKYLDVDNLLRYMAVHSFMVNEDSLSGSMAHNYYLYEYEGRLNILPWDYNLSFGGMSVGNGKGGGVDASAMVNDPVDDPFSGTRFFDVLLENETYLEQYHRYYRQLVEEYVFGGEFERTYSRIRSQIDELVKTDPNAMYSYEEYDEGAGMLYDTVMLRAESVLGQLDGTIPSTREGQKENPEALVDASAIRTSAMGTFGGGGGPDFSGNGFAQPGQRGERPGGAGLRE